MDKCILVYQKCKCFSFSVHWFIHFVLKEALKFVVYCYTCTYVKHSFNKRYCNLVYGVNTLKSCSYMKPIMLLGYNQVSSKLYIPAVINFIYFNRYREQSAPCSSLSCGWVKLESLRSENCAKFPLK